MPGKEILTVKRIMIGVPVPTAYLLSRDFTPLSTLLDVNDGLCTVPTKLLTSFHH